MDSEIGSINKIKDTEKTKTDPGGGGSQKDQQNSSQHHNHRFVHQFLKTMLVFAALALAFIVLYRSADRFQFFPTSFYNSFSSSDGFSSPDLQELKRVLKKAAMVDKTVIITTLNEAWAASNSIFDLFLNSFKIGNQTEELLNHLLVVALDQKAHAQCLKSHPYCYTLRTDGIDFSGEAYFMTADYLKMMWRRIEFLQTILEMGYNFIFTDTDIMWFRDPFPQFYPDADFQIACDYYRGNPSNLNNAPNGGFTYVKSNSKTKQFYRFWHESRNLYPGNHDQDVLNKIKRDPRIQQIGLQIKFLDTAYFGGFCQPSKDFNLVCTMHANCCVGLANKVHDLILMLEDWRKYMSQSEMNWSKQSWSVPQHCGYAVPDS
ncbi:hypothetical protein ACH5RR_003336 [Cinchona calisaya]|uniref:Nucleotide-diphospho-sugar transferase domain-containing protein n=1 Tax=Cinchona calisaya TaxID=153742 RepID=A0ABD3AUP2_9GENT